MEKIVADVRREALANIRRMLKSKMWESGYVYRPLTPKSRPLKIWVPLSSKGTTRDKMFFFKPYKSVSEFQGFTECGFILDSFGAGLKTLAWEDVPVEDLLQLRKWLYRNLEKLHLEHLTGVAAVKKRAGS